MEQPKIQTTILFGQKTSEGSRHSRCLASTFLRHATSSFVLFDNPPNGVRVRLVYPSLPFLLSDVERRRSIHPHPPLTTIDPESWGRPGEQNRGTKGRDVADIFRYEEGIVRGMRRASSRSMVKLFIRIFESILKSKDDFDRIFSLFLFKRREIDDRISKYGDNIISTSGCPLLPTTRPRI